MALPRRIRRQTGRHALVDGIPFELPVNSEHSPALMAGFSIDLERARELLPGNELHPVRLPNGRGVLLVTVIDYRTTDIGAYIEYSIAIGCTRGPSPVSVARAILLMKRSGTGQFVWDLPVSTLFSVKGGKGIWGMPKHQANLDFRIDGSTVTSQYDLDGALCTKVEIGTPRLRVPVRNFGAVNWCAFRGMLMKSSIYFSDTMRVALGRGARASFVVGDHPRMAPLRELDIRKRPFFVAWLPDSHGMLDDHFESWFLSFETAPSLKPEGLESVIDLTNDTTWLSPPRDHAVTR